MFIPFRIWEARQTGAPHLQKHSAVKFILVDLYQTYTCCPISNHKQNLLARINSMANHSWAVQQSGFGPAKPPTAAAEPQRGAYGAVVWHCCLGNNTGANLDSARIAASVPYNLFFQTDRHTAWCTVSGMVVAEIP
jgi:hypothetical protein